MSRKAVLEELLRSRRLHRDAPALRGEASGPRPIATGSTALDALLRGGFPRGCVSELYGPRSSGCTGFALSLLARCSREGGLTAWVDPTDAFDPDSASAAGCDLSRLLWIRGGAEGALGDALTALGVVLGSGLFEIVVLDVSEIPRHELRRLPGSTWHRLGQLVADTPTALLLLGDTHVPFAARGPVLAFSGGRARWSGAAGPGRLFDGLETSTRLQGSAAPGVALSLQAVH